MVRWPMAAKEIAVKKRVEYSRLDGCGTVKRQYNVVPGAGGNRGRMKRTAPAAFRLVPTAHIELPVIDVDAHAPRSAARFEQNLA